MGLNKEQNNNILLTHCGSAAKKYGGIIKQQFIESVSNGKKYDIRDINNLLTLTQYRINQLIDAPNVYKRHKIHNKLKHNSIRRTQSNSALLKPDKIHVTFTLEEPSEEIYNDEIVRTS